MPVGAVVAGDIRVEHTTRVGERAADIQVCSVRSERQGRTAEADVRPISSIPLRQTGRGQAAGAGENAPDVNVVPQKTYIVDDSVSAGQFAERGAPVGAVESVHASIGGDEAAIGYGQTAGVQGVAVEAEGVNVIGGAGQAELPVPVTVSRGSEERTSGAAQSDRKEKRA